MTVNKEIDVRMRLQILLGVEYQWFLMFAHVFGLLTIFPLQATMLGPLHSKINAPTGVKHRKEALQGLAMEHRTKRLEFPITVSQAISMSQIKFLAVNLAGQRFTMDDDTTFLLQIIPTPDIMISDKEIIQAFNISDNEGYKKLIDAYGNYVYTIITSKVNTLACEQ